VEGENAMNAFWPRAGILFAAFLAFAGCSKDPMDTPFSASLAGDFSTPVQIQVDNFVRRKPPMVYVSPRANADQKPRALFVPLRCMQQIANPVSFSDMISRQIWQMWLSQGGFAVLEYAPDAGLFEPQRALSLARQKGADYVVGGYINHYMDGGSGGESSVSLAVEMYDVKSGALLWSMAQAGYMEARQVHDFYLFSIKERNPLDVSGLIVRTLAWDMGDTVLAWADRTAKRSSGSGLDIRSLTGGPKAF
jgi:TolB-like protein